MRDTPHDTDTPRPSSTGLSPYMAPREPSLAIGYVRYSSCAKLDTGTHRHSQRGCTAVIGRGHRNNILSWFSGLMLYSAFQVIYLIYRYTIRTIATEPTNPRRWDNTGSGYHSRFSVSVGNYAARFSGLEWGAQGKWIWDPGRVKKALRSYIYTSIEISSTMKWNENINQPIPSAPYSILSYPTQISHPQLLSPTSPATSSQLNFSLLSNQTSTTLLNWRIT